MPHDKTLAGMITDWGGFEQLIADVHAMPGFTVERDVELPAKEGGTYRVDVVLRWRQGIYDVVMICECKWWTRPVERSVITHLRHVREQVGANKAACFTSVGFQSGAEDVARAHDIDLFRVRQRSDDEWGAPGPVVSILMQTFQPAISPMTFPGALVLSGPASAPTTLDPRDILIKRADGTPAGTLEDTCDQLRSKAYEHRHRGPMGGGTDGVYYHAVNLAARFDGGSRIVELGPQTLRVDGCACEIVFRIQQNEITVDRRANFDHSLVLEDFVRGISWAASRRSGSDAEIGPLVVEVPDPSRPVVQNGQLLQILVRGFGDYEEFAAEMARIEAGSDGASI